jgi:hypothetical protein
MFRPARYSGLNQSEIAYPPSKSGVVATRMRVSEHKFDLQALNSLSGTSLLSYDRECAHRDGATPLVVSHNADTGTASKLRSKLSIWSPG